MSASHDQPNVGDSSLTESMVSSTSACTATDVETSFTSVSYGGRRKWRKTHKSVILHVREVRAAIEEEDDANDLEYEDFDENLEESTGDQPGENRTACSQNASVQQYNKQD